MACVVVAWAVVMGIGAWLHSRVPTLQPRNVHKEAASELVVPQLLYHVPWNARESALHAHGLHCSCRPDV